MPDNPPPDLSLEEQAKNYYRKLIKAGLTVDEMAERSGESRSTIYRRFELWGWKRGWVEVDPPTGAPPAPKTKRAPTTSPPSAPPPKTAPTAGHHDFLDPEIRARMEEVKRKRG